LRPSDVAGSEGDWCGVDRMVANGHAYAGEAMADAGEAMADGRHPIPFVTRIFYGSHWKASGFNGL
jgi:hypothetical protein